MNGEIFERIKDRAQQAVARFAGKNTCTSCYEDGIPLFIGSHADGHIGVANLKSGIRGNYIISPETFEALDRTARVRTYINRRVIEQHVAPLEDFSSNTEK